MATNDDVKKLTKRVKELENNIPPQINALKQRIADMEIELEALQESLHEDD